VVEAPERTIVVGRSAGADVVIADPTVAPRHAELVVTSHGRLHLTDCATATGTWLRDGATGTWQQVRQQFVAREAELRLGDHACRAGDLVGATAGSDGARHGGSVAPASLGTRRGRIERDPATGEIVRRRF
jgi:hypothetical protein